MNVSKLKSLLDGFDGAKEVHIITPANGYTSRIRLRPTTFFNSDDVATVALVIERDTAVVEEQELASALEEALSALSTISSIMSGNARESYINANNTLSIWKQQEGR